MVSIADEMLGDQAGQPLKNRSECATTLGYHNSRREIVPSCYRMKPLARRVLVAWYHPTTTIPNRSSPWTGVRDNNNVSDDQNEASRIARRPSSQLNLELELIKSRSSSFIFLFELFPHGDICIPRVSLFAFIAILLDRV